MNDFFGQPLEYLDVGFDGIHGLTTEAPTGKIRLDEAVFTLPPGHEARLSKRKGRTSVINLALALEIGELPGRISRIAALGRRILIRGN